MRTAKTPSRSRVAVPSCDHAGIRRGRAGGGGSMATCSGCATELPEAARFCMTCGTPVLPPGCASCGGALQSRGAVLHAVRGAGRRRPAGVAVGRSACRRPTGVGAAGHLGAVRRPGGVHDAVGEPRPRGGARAPVPLLRRVPHGDRSLRRRRGEVHRRRRDGRLGSARRARGRRGARRTCRARARGGRHRHGRGRRCARAGDARRRRHGRGGGDARRDRRGHGRRRRGQHGVPRAERRGPGTGVGRRDDAVAHDRGRRLPGRRRALASRARPSRCTCSRRGPSWPSSAAASASTGSRRR